MKTILPAITPREESKQDVTVDYHFHGRSAQKAWHKLEVGKIKGTDCSIQ